MDEPGTFANAANPRGMLYQWNRKKGWPATGTVTGWDTFFSSGDFWEAANDPCPAGWRVPTIEEMKKLLDKSRVTSDSVFIDGIIGKAYTDRLTGNRIFYLSLSVVRLMAFCVQMEIQDSIGRVHLFFLI